MMSRDSLFTYVISSSSSPISRWHAAAGAASSGAAAGIGRPGGRGLESLDRGLRQLGGEVGQA